MIASAPTIATETRQLVASATIPATGTPMTLAMVFMPITVPIALPRSRNGNVSAIENTNPAVRVTIRLYAVEDGVGSFFPNWDPNEPIPARYWARVDVTSKDKNNLETNGNGVVEFFVSTPRLIEVTGGHTNQRRLKALSTPVTTDVWATQDGVTSNKITLTFK